MKRALKYFLICLYLLIFIVPGYIYFVVNQTGESLFASDINIQSRMLILFRLFGLYAFVLVWSQVVLSTLRKPLQQLFGSRIIKMHIFLGTFTLLFALTHYSLFTVANLLNGLDPIKGIAIYLGPYVIYGYLGVLAFYLMVLTVVSGLLRAMPFMEHYWRKIHYLNYVIFILAFIHSFYLGTEVQHPAMKILYYFFGLSYIVAASYKWIYKRLLHR